MLPVAAFFCDRLLLLGVRELRIDLGDIGVGLGDCLVGGALSFERDLLDRAETAAPGVGALRMRLVAVRDGTPPFQLRDAAGKYAPDVLLDLDYWVLMPV